MEPNSPAVGQAVHKEFILGALLNINPLYVSDFSFLLYYLSKHDVSGLRKKRRGIILWKSSLSLPPLNTGIKSCFFLSFSFYGLC